MLLNKQYEIVKDVPKPIEWEEYYNRIMDEYEGLLAQKADDEKAFQVFFEENPSFLPGAYKLSGKSPFMEAVISQPEIGGILKRKPDFVWLANDSTTFAPVFIEIERPNKKMFNKSEVVTSDFSQAMGQIQQWQYILSQPNNLNILYDYFNISNDLRTMIFRPQYLLIYGRREEYEDNSLRTGTRAACQTDNINIVSYDRLRPISDYSQFITCKVSSACYKVIHIPPTFRYRPGWAVDLVRMKGFYDRIDDMKYTSNERKEFLKKRYTYWYEFGKKKDKGLMRLSESE